MAISIFKIQLKKTFKKVNLCALMNFYCERTTEQIFDEPINAISNIFFIIVSLSLLKYLEKSK